MTASPARSSPVVVGVDGSPDSAGALRWAAWEAATRKTSLRVVYARDPADPLWSDQAPRVVDDGVASAHGWQPGVPADGVVLDGPPAAGLCAQTAHAGLLVVGGRGRGTWAGLLLGSVSAQVAADAHCPVLVVRHGYRWAGPETTLGSDRPVVVGIDASPASEQVAGAAFEEAAARGVTLVVVRGWEPPAAPWRSDVRPLVRDVAEIETAERRLLAETVESWRAKYPHLTVELRLVSESADAALMAASRTAQLAVVGSRGRGGFGGLLLGSVSQHLVHHAHCPVLVVHPATGDRTP